MLIFGIYIIFTICYIGVFIEEKNVLHFLDWSLIATIIFIFYISVISPIEKQILKNIILFLFTFIVIIYLKGSLNKYISFVFEKLINFKGNIYNLEFYKHLIYWHKYILGLIFLSILNIIFRISFTEKLKKENSDKLYSVRSEDFNKIKNFLLKESEVNILGIDDQFGEGKSFLVDKVIESVTEDKKSEIEIIKIRCLLLEKEEVYSYISKQINRVLIKNLIFKGYDEKIKNSLIKGVYGRIFGAFDNLLIRENKVDDIENLKKNILKLKKTIILIFDDIDRVGDSSVIDKILSFVSDFSCNNIKILILYYGDNLEKVNKKYNRNYIEKYIPRTSNLTKISFEEILRKGINDKNLNMEDFNFLLSLVVSENKLYQNKDSSIKNNDLIFRNDLEKVLSYRKKFKLDITPRKFQIFFEELIENLGYEEKGIEKRLIIGFTFLKCFMYKEFYQKIDNIIEMGFENLYPIKLGLESSKIKINLSEYRIFKMLAEELDELKIKDGFIKFEKYKIIIQKDINSYETSINDYLEKLKLEKINDKDKEAEIVCKLNKIKDVLKKLRVTKETEKNIIICDLLNYYLEFNHNLDKYLERKSTIEGAIQKLKFIGTKEYLSPDNRFYRKLSKILKKEYNSSEKNMRIMNKKYEKLLKEYLECNGSFKTIFYYNREYFSETIVKVLNVLGNKQEKEQFLNLIFFRGGEKITDEYIYMFLENSTIDIKKSDFLIGEIIKGNYAIEDKKTVTKIRKKIDKILKRVNRIFYEYQLEKINDIKFFKGMKNFLESNPMGGNKFFKDKKISEINIGIINYIKFLEKMIEISEKINFNNSQDIIKNRKIIKSEEKEEYIKKLSNEEKEEYIKKMYNQGKDFYSLEKYYDKLFLENKEETKEN